MFGFNIFLFALKNLRRKPLRVAILTLAIATLGTVVFFSSVFTQKVKRSISQMSARLGADLIVVPTGSKRSVENILLENQAKSFYMSKNILEKLKNIEGITQITFQTYLVTLTATCCSVPETLVVVFDPETDFIIKPWLKKKDELKKLKPGEAIAGAESAYNIRLELVDISLFGKNFSIVETLDKTGTGLDTALFISPESYEELIKNHSALAEFKDKVSVIFIKADPAYDLEKIEKEIENNIIEVDVVTRKDIGRELIKTLRDINLIFMFVIILLGVVTFVLTWAVFSAVVNERYFEIGILRAMGAKYRDILKLFLIESIIVSLIGSILGIIIGVFCYKGITPWFYSFRLLSAPLPLVSYLILLGLVLFINLSIPIVGALIPLLRFRRMEPLTLIKKGG